MFIMEKYIVKYADKLFWALIISGIAPVFFYRTEFNVPYVLAFKYAAIPVLIISYTLAFFYMPKWKQTTGPIMRQIMPLLVSGLVVLFMGGHLMAINALIGPQHERTIVGEIVDMNTSGGRSTTYTATVIDSNTLQTKELELTTREFKTYRIGDIYERKWHEGSLGFLYLKK
jgi:hypothetical protein